MTALPRIGCAGWTVPAVHRHLCEARENALARYASRFNAVEINSSFYRPHKRKTYAGWAQCVPEDFRFAVKLPKAITHVAKLQGGLDLMDAFVEEIAGLEHKLGVVLVQLPPSLAFNLAIAEEFFAEVRQRYQGPIAFEPRHPTWFDPALDDFYLSHGISRAGADPARVPAAADPAGDARVRYWRWHGSPRMYFSAYDDARLSALATHLRYSQDPARSWVIFDNTGGGHAVADAARLQGQLKIETADA